jgi:aminoglycoside phosphotransferase
VNAAVKRERKTFRTPAELKDERERERWYLKSVLQAPYIPREKNNRDSSVASFRNLHMYEKAVIFQKRRRYTVSVEEDQDRDVADTMSDFK